MLKVAQCWDDGLVTDIRLIEILRKHGAKATFNLNPALHRKSERVPSWIHQGFQAWGVAQDEMKELYAGFQVASHTMHHPRASQIPVGEFVRDAVDARRWIEDFFQQEAPGFAWPCGDTTPEAAAALADAGFAYGRTTCNTDRVWPVAQPMLLDSSCHFLSPDFWNAFEKARACGIFYFWGHSCELHDDEALWRGFEENIARLSSDPEVQWIDVIDIVR